MLTENDTLLKNHVSFNFMLKYYITISFRQFPKILNQFFTYAGQTKILKLACLFVLIYWTNQSRFEVISLDNVLINWHYLKNATYDVRLKLHM